MPRLHGRDHDTHRHLGIAHHPSKSDALIDSIGPNRRCDTTLTLAGPLARAGHRRAASPNPSGHCGGALDVERRESATSMLPFTPRASEHPDHQFPSQHRRHAIGHAPHHTMMGRHPDQNGPPQLASSKPSWTRDGDSHDGDPQGGAATSQGSRAPRRSSIEPSPRKSPHRISSSLKKWEAP
jgi:hypothetical protein